MDKLLFDDIVSDTLLIPLWMRAEESRRSDRLFEDKEAEELVRLLSVDFSKFENKKLTRVGTAIRVSLFDHRAQRALRRKNPVLVHLGCGLDNRFGRVDTGEGIHINIDLPEVISFRNKLNINNNERNILMVGSILETDWMDALLEKYPEGSFSFFIEGVLVYFTEQQVRQLFIELIKRFRGASICFDGYSNRLVKKSDTHETVGQMKARFKWGIDDIKQLESWSPHLKHVSTDYMMKLHPGKWGRYSLVRLIPGMAKCAFVSVFRITP